MKNIKMGKDCKQGHTPGPWSIKHEGLTAPIYWIEGPRREEIGEGYGKANAALIAAAPELLDVLRYYMVEYAHVLKEDKFLPFEKAWAVLKKTGAV